MKYFIIFCLYYTLTYGGIIKTTERSEPIDTTTVSKMLNVTVKDENSESASEKSIAQTRDEEATIMLAQETLFKAANTAELKSDLQMADAERSGKLLLLSTPKLTDKNQTEEEQDENIKETSTMADEMKVKEQEIGTERNFINNYNKKDNKNNKPVTPSNQSSTQSSSQPSSQHDILSKSLMEVNENVKGKEEMEKNPKREMQIDASASNARVYHLHHDEPLDYVAVINDDTHASHVLEADLHPATIVESAHFVPASIEADLHW